MRIYVSSNLEVWCNIDAWFFPPCCCKEIVTSLAAFWLLMPSDTTPIVAIKEVVFYE
jgi:hypothetical protein